MASPLLHRGWKKESTLKRISMREGLGLGLVEAGKKHDNFFVLTADVTSSVKANDFKKAFPKRFVQMGVSEQSMAAIGAGLALDDNIAAICTFGAFSPGRNWEQIRTTIALQNANVKILSTHCGVNVGPDGATHQMTEDVALIRTLPNMIVLAPADAIEAEKATILAADIKTPVYIRFERSKSPVFTTRTSPFAIGKANVLRKGKDVALIGCGSAVYTLLQAALELEKLGVDARVINNSSIKPLDEKTLIDAAKNCGCIVTLEDHQVMGGMGSAIAELISEEYPVPIERLGVQDKFGQSGEPEELRKYYKMTKDDVIKAVKKIIKKK